MAEIVLRKISKKFGHVTAVDDLSLDVENGEFMVLVGPSGCGKTTTLRIIAGLERQDNGDVLIDGVLVNDVKPEKRGMHMVFQHYALWPHMKVFDDKDYTNISFALKLRNWVKEDIINRANAISKKVGLDKSLFSRFPDGRRKSQKLVKQRDFCIGNFENRCNLRALRGSEPDKCFHRVKLRPP